MHYMHCHLAYKLTPIWRQGKPTVNCPNWFCFPALPTPMHCSNRDVAFLSAKMEKRVWEIFVQFRKNIFNLINKAKFKRICVLDICLRLQQLEKRVVFSSKRTFSISRTNKISKFGFQSLVCRLKHKENARNWSAIHIMCCIWEKFGQICGIFGAWPKAVRLWSLDCLIWLRGGQCTVGQINKIWLDTAMVDLGSAMQCHISLLCSN